VAAVTAPSGVFGGAFDPPHVGHVELARAGVERFALQRLLVRVVEDPGHKAVRTPAPVRRRLAELAFASVAAAEVALDRFARTVDSLESLALPDPVFLVGADEFASFLEWKEPARVLELARDPGTGLVLPDRAAARVVLGDPAPCRSRGSDRRARPDSGRGRDRPPRSLPRR